MFVPHSELDLKKMFDELKINSLDDLFTHIPDALLLENGLDLPESLSELESIDSVSYTHLTLPTKRIV